MRHRLAFLVLLACGPAVAAETAHWSYEGEAGPAAWGALAPENAACGTGVQQSPIDIAARGSVAAQPPALAFGWRPFRPGVVDNGHTVQVNTSGAGGGVTLGGVDFRLEQFHFHHRSEHAIDGARAPMEVHFVHRAADGRLLVVGGMIVEGAPNPALAALWPLAGAAGVETAGAEPVDPFALLAPGDDAFRYEGSLTTPPCSEIVTWHVMAAPVSASAEQIAAFAARHPDNARPLQALARRFVLRTR